MLSSSLIIASSSPRRSGCRWRGIDHAAVMRKMIFSRRSVVRGLPGASPTGVDARSRVVGRAAGRSPPRRTWRSRAARPGRRTSPQVDVRVASARTRSPRRYQDQVVRLELLSGSARFVEGPRAVRAGASRPERVGGQSGQEESTRRKREPPPTIIVLRLFLRPAAGTATPRAMRWPDLPSGAEVLDSRSPRPLRRRAPARDPREGSSRGGADHEDSPFATRSAPACPARGAALLRGAWPGVRGAGSAAPAAARFRTSRRTAVTTDARSAPFTRKLSSRMPDSRRRAATTSASISRISPPPARAEEDSAAKARMRPGSFGSSAILQPDEGPLHGGSRGGGRRASARVRRPRRGPREGEGAPRHQRAVRGREESSSCPHALRLSRAGGPVGVLTTFALIS